MGFLFFTFLSQKVMIFGFSGENSGVFCSKVKPTGLTQNKRNDVVTFIWVHPSFYFVIGE